MQGEAVGAFKDRLRRIWCSPQYRGRDDYNRRRADKGLRPARTFREQESRLARLPEPQRRARQVAQPIATAVARRTSPIKYERITVDAGQKISRQATAVRTFREERRRWESKATDPQSLQPSGDRKAVAAPPAEPREPVRPPRERGGNVAAPSAQRDAPHVPPRSAHVSQPERVQIPTPPVAGGWTGFFHRGPPARPKGEDKDKEGKVLHRN